MIRLFFMIACLSPFMPVVAETGLTIYSKAQPGAVSAAQYRPTTQGGGWNHYNQIPGYAIIRETRNISLPQTRNMISFDDVAAYIDPTTVQVRSLTAPKETSVIEQNFHFDLVSQQKLLERFLGKEIIVEQLRGEKVDVIEGILLSSNWGQLVLQDAEGGIVTVGNYSNVRFPELPGGLRTKPTLVWDIATEQPGTHAIEASYQTDGITWWADYNAEYRDGPDENHGFLDLSAWVSIINKTGASYENAALKLIAGDVQRVTPARNTLGKEMGRQAAPMDMSTVAGFAEKAFFEFHLYTLGRRTDLPDNSTKQIELFERKGNIPVEKEFVYNGQQYPKDVGVFVVFDNTEDAGLGLPLPAGRIRMNKRDTADDSLEFIGEDTIVHTPKDEEIRIKLGNAFDVKGKREIMEKTQNNAQQWRTETVKITVKNHKEKPIDLIVREYFYGNWKLKKNSHDMKKINAHTAEFPVRLKANEEEVITFTAHYSWK